MTMTKEQARELFEVKCRELHDQGKISLPLGAMEVNGKFSHYMDSDTDSAWIGFCAGLGVMAEERDALAKKLLAEQKSHETTVGQRDWAEEMADQLSQAIMGITGRDIGEHSSANCPWANAIEHAEEYQAERDALAAHLERGNIIWSQWENRGPEGMVYKYLTDGLAEWFKDKPDTTSLARRDAQMKAEELDKEADGFERDVADSDTCTERLIYKRVVRNLRTAASELRSQAEAGTPRPRECRCTFAQKTVGDGCAVCQPEGGEQ